MAPKEPKPIVVSDDDKTKIVDLLKANPSGLGVDQLAEKLAIKVGSLRPKMPVLVRDAVIKSRPDGRRNIYFLEKQ